jgi:hypothetical protein
MSSYNLGKFWISCNIQVNNIASRYKSKSLQQLFPNSSKSFAIINFCIFFILKNLIIHTVPYLNYPTINTR